MKYIILLIAFSIASCTPKISSNKCSIEGTMRDMTGLDGCGFLIELDNGTKLNGSWGNLVEVKKNHLKA
jgi:hypothetical protein